MSSKKLAELVSIVLGPFVWPFVLVAAIVYKVPLPFDQLKILLPAIIFLEIIVPISYLLIGPKLGWTSSWDTKNLKERKSFLALVLGATLISLYFVYLFGNKLLFDIGTVMIAYLVVFFLVNHFWRMSLHAGLNTAATILVNFLFNWTLPWLFLSIPVIFWARLELKRHSTPQLIVGIVVSVLIATGGLHFFGYV